MNQRNRGMWRLVTSLIAACAISLLGTVLAAPAQAVTPPRAVTPLQVDGFFQIVNFRSGTCLDVLNESTRPNARVQGVRCKNINGQRWGFAFTDSGFSKVINRNSAMCLDIASNFPAQNGDSLQQFTCDIAAQWLKQDIPAVPGVFKLQDRTSGRCMDLANGSSADGTRVMTWDCQDGNPNQLWLLR